MQKKKKDEGRRTDIFWTNFMFPYPDNNEDFYPLNCPANTCSNFLFHKNQFIIILLFPFENLKEYSQWISNHFKTREKKNLKDL